MNLEENRIKNAGHKENFISYFTNQNDLKPSESDESET